MFQSTNSIIMSEEKFEEDFPEEDFENISQEINENLSNIRSSTDQFFKRKLIIFCIRWTITLVLLVLLIGKYPWIKYLMYVAIPLGILNLAMIFIGRKKINEKLSDTEDKINSL